MSTFEGKTAAQWIDLLGSHRIHERCAAALALAEFEPNVPPVKDALLPALHDRETPVQVAVQIGIGFIHVPVENRRRMVQVLLGPDNDDFRDALKALHELAFSNLLGTASKPADESSEAEAADRMPQPRPAAVGPDPADPMPDIAKVHLFPWWFLIGAIGLCLLFGWLTRGVWWPKWVMAGLAAVAGLFLLFAHSRQGAGKLPTVRYRAHVRMAGSALFAFACGFAVGLLFPAGTVLIDNESGAKVRILLNGEPWHAADTGTSTSKLLAPGKYRLTIKPALGEQVLDEFPIEIAGSERRILNVLGAQVYFQGVVQYGAGQGHDMKMVTERWIAVPNVDYLFCDLPAVIQSPHPINKSYFTRGAPPKMRGK